MSTTCFRISEEYNSARRLYQFVLDSWPECEDARLARSGLIQCEIDRGNIEQAEMELDVLLSALPAGEDFSGSLYDIAGSYFAAREYASARWLYEFVIDSWPEAEDTPSAKGGVIRSNLMLGNIDVADSDVIELLLEAGVGSEKLTVESRKTAQFLLKVGRHYFAQAIKHEEKGQSDEAELNFVKALGFYNKVIDEFPADIAYTPDAYRLSAECYKQLGEYETAIEYYRIILDNWPEHHQASTVEFLLDICLRKVD